MAVAMILCCSLCSFWLLYRFFRKYYTINCLLLFKSCLSYNSQFFLSCNYKRNLLFNICNFINILQFFYQKYLTFTTYFLQCQYENKPINSLFKKEEKKSKRQSQSTVNTTQSKQTYGSIMAPDSVSMDISWTFITEF